MVQWRNCSLKWNKANNALCSPIVSQNTFPLLFNLNVFWNIVVNLKKLLNSSIYLFYLQKSFLLGIMQVFIKHLIMVCFSFSVLENKNSGPYLFFQRQFWSSVKVCIYSVSKRLLTWLTLLYFEKYLILIYRSLMTDVVEHVFICSFAICICRW